MMDLERLASNAPLEQAVGTPEWVMRMRAHFQQTGFYRADDVRRLLGDPRRHVDLASNPDIVSCLLSRR